jgi:protein SCO1/2
MEMPIHQSRLLKPDGLLLAALLLAGTANLPAANITVQVLAADPKAFTLTVKGAGLPAPDKDGTEVLRVDQGDPLVGYVGHAITGDLGKSSGQWWLNTIWPADPALLAATTAATQQLHQDAVELGRKAIRGVGDNLPAFALFNQNGEIVRPDTLRGRRLVINFIFTRCANANMCPANTKRMAELQQQAKAAKIANVDFVTITIDPENDTPGALRRYADVYGLDLSNYQLLTGPLDEMGEVLQQFGILTRQENGQLVHTLALLIVSPEGRIVFRKDSDLWTVAEVLDRIKPATPAAVADKPKAS